MLIMSLKPGHDGTVAAIDNGRLLFSLEAEKDSFAGYERLTPSIVVAAGRYLGDVPDVIAVSGWIKGVHPDSDRALESGYYGSHDANIRVSRQKFMGRSVDIFSSSHERSHILGAYGMSPFPQGQPVYALVWEGTIGKFYWIDEDVKVHELGSVMTDPGNKYATLFKIADPTFPPIAGILRHEDAGKLMALAAYSDRSTPNDDERHLISRLLDTKDPIIEVPKTAYHDSPFFNIGVDSPQFKNLAGKFSRALFERFRAFAFSHMKPGFPLLISGGCGLNCDWNTAWEQTGLFPEVFVPPCANDSGSAIGTGVDAQHHFSGSAKVEWNVYAGEPFVEDISDVPDGFTLRRLDIDEVADRLAQDHVIAWAQGRYEIGPRAPGNRSILAAPFSEATTRRLNHIKKREGYRPVAPICLEDEALCLFGRKRPSPYMLHFDHVRDPRLQAITHVDGTARIQTVGREQNPPIHELLTSFKKRTGYGVLCNTSLNFNGKGFINRTSDLADYCRSRDLDGFVVHDKLYAAANR